MSFVRLWLSGDNSSSFFDRYIIGQCILCQFPSWKRNYCDVMFKVSTEEFGCLEQREASRFDFHYYDSLYLSFSSSSSTLFTSTPVMESRRSTGIPPAAIHERSQVHSQAGTEGIWDTDIALNLWLRNLRFDFLFHFAPSSYMHICHRLIFSSILKCNNRDSYVSCIDIIAHQWNPIIQLASKVRACATYVRDSFTHLLISG